MEEENFDNKFFIFFYRYLHPVLTFSQYFQIQ